MGSLAEIIFLCGFSGSGKTEVGEILATKLGYEYTDTDKTVEGHLNKTIPEIFAQLGEDKFRFMESDAIRMAIQKKPQVISLGGGTIHDHHILEYVKAFGLLIYLEASPETIYERLQNSHMRPMLEIMEKEEESEKDAIMKRINGLFAERLKYYDQAHQKLSTEGKTVEQVAEEIEGLLRQDAK